LAVKGLKKTGTLSQPIFLDHVAL